MRGRNPAGPEFVKRLEGSEKAKLRAQVVLELLAGKHRVSEACERLGIKDARLDQLRNEGLQAMVTALEDRPPGRPAHEPTPAERENERLRAEIERLRAEQKAALIRAELAVALPRIGAESKKNDIAEATPTENIPNPEVPGLSAPSEETIVAHFKKLISNKQVAEGPPRRGFAGQRTDRENEHVIRGHVVASSDLLVQQGWTWSATANLFGVSDRTLREWRSNLAGAQPLDVLPLGRPAHLAPPAERNLVIRRIDELGPAIGVPSLRTQFPNLRRVEIANILDRFRRIWRRRHREVLMELDWATPGTVWAIDFHGPRAQAVDGRCPYLLAVRDLASGQVLLWLPVADATVRTLVDVIRPLFIVHGAPLVLKSDNGSAFIAEQFRKLCEQFAVKNLYSPPCMPGYNGSIEATIGSLKNRTERYAALRLGPGHWTTADTEAARHEANAVTRPNGTCPAQVWTARPMIAPAQRHAFFEAATRRFESIAQAQPEYPGTDAQRRATDRDAISQVLVELGYLSITRGRYRLPVCKKKVAETR